MMSPSLKLEIVPPFFTNINSRKKAYNLFPQVGHAFNSLAYSFLYVAHFHPE